MSSLKHANFQLYGELIIIKNNRDKAHRLFDSLDGITQELFQETLGIAMNVQGGVFTIGVSSAVPWTSTLSLKAANIMRTLKHLLETPVSDIRGLGFNIENGPQGPDRTDHGAAQGSEPENHPMRNAHNDATGIDMLEGAANPDRDANEARSTPPSEFRPSANLERVALFVEKAQRSARALGQDRIALKSGGESGVTSPFLHRIPDEPPGPAYDEGVDCELLIMVTGIKQAPALLEVDIRKNGGEEMDVRAKIPVTGEAAGEAIQALLKARELKVQARMFSAEKLRKYEIDGKSLLSALKNDI